MFVVAGLVGRSSRFNSDDGTVHHPHSVELVEKTLTLEDLVSWEEDSMLGTIQWLLKGGSSISSHLPGVTGAASKRHGGYALYTVAARIAKNNE